MLLDVGVGLLAGELPRMGTGDLRTAGTGQADTFGTGDAFLDTAGRAYLLAAHAQRKSIIRVRVLEAEVVEDVTVLLAGTGLAPADTEDRGRVCLERPVGDIDVVHVLLDDVVTGEPRVVEPVAQLILHLAARGLRLTHPETTHVPVDACGHRLADRTIVDPLHRLEVALLVAALRTCNNGALLRVSFLGRSDHLPDASRIDGNGLLHEDVLVAGDGSLEMHRPEARRRRQDHVVAVSCDDVLVGVPAGETVRLIGDRPVTEAFVPDLLELVARTLQAISEDVAHGVDAHILGGLQRVDSCAGPAAATPDHPDTKFIFATELAVGQCGGCQGQCRTQGAGCDEVAAGDARALLVFMAAHRNPPGLGYCRLRSQGRSGARRRTPHPPATNCSWGTGGRCRSMRVCARRCSLR